MLLLSFSSDLTILFFTAEIYIMTYPTVPTIPYSKIYPIYPQSMVDNVFHLPVR